MTPQQILDLKQKIRELDAAAANGPWKVDHVGNIRTQRGGVMPHTFRDADFIAFARTALPTLLAYCEELEGKVKVAEDALLAIHENPFYSRDDCGEHAGRTLLTLNPSNP